MFLYAFLQLKKMHHLLIYTKEDLNITCHHNSRGSLPFKCSCKNRQGAIYDRGTCREMYVTKLSGSNDAEKEDNVLSTVDYLMILTVSWPYSI
jgi:hypothetical protein